MGTVTSALIFPRSRKNGDSYLRPYFSPRTKPFLSAFDSEYVCRKSRIVIPNVPHHVTQRGSRRGLVFFDDEERAFYLQLLRKYTSLYGVIVLAYCLMDNHIHAVLVPLIRESLARVLSATHMRYAQVVNAKHGWSGHLWQERFYSSPLDGDHLWTALRYVERNPVEAGLVQHASDYQWSSAKAHCDIGTCDPYLTPDRAWTSVLTEKQDWYQWLQEKDDIERLLFLEDQTRRDLPTGSMEFMLELEASFGVSIISKPVGRPKTERITVPNKWGRR